MADKIKAIKIKQKNGTYSEEVPISVNVQNVQWDENNHTLLDALGSVDISSSGKGNLQHQIDELDGDKISTNEFNSRLNDFLKDQISADTTDWLDDNVNPVGSAVIVDKTLTIEGAAADALAVKTELNKKANASNTYTKAEVNAAIDAKQIEVDDTLSIIGTAADAKAVGDELTTVKTELGDLSSLETHTRSDIVSAINEAAQNGLSNAAKEALLACFRNLVWRDTSLGQNLYNSLVSALEAHDVIAFGDLTQFEIGQRGFTRTSGTYINRTLPAWCACDISSLNFNVGDKIKLIGALKNTYVFNVGTRDLNATVTAKTFIKSENTSDDLVLEASNITDAKAIEVRRQDSANLTNQDISVISNGIVWEKSDNDIYHTYKFEYPSTLLKASGQIELLDSPYGLQHTSNAGRRTIYMGYGKIPYASGASGNPLVAEYPIPIPDDAISVKVSITPNTQFIYLGLLVWDSANNKYTRTRGFAWAQGVSNANLSSYMSKNRSLMINTKYNEAGTSYPAEPTKVVVEFTKGESNEQ